MELTLLWGNESGTMGLSPCLIRETNYGNTSKGPILPLVLYYVHQTEIESLPSLTSTSNIQTNTHPPSSLPFLSLTTQAPCYNELHSSFIPVRRSFVTHLHRVINITPHKAVISDFHFVMVNHDVIHLLVSFKQCYFDIAMDHVLGMKIHQSLCHFHQNMLLLLVTHVRMLIHVIR